MSLPIFSIVTITLNREDDVISTAKSVLAQEFSDYEYIVKDGGSTDLTLHNLSALGISAYSSPDAGIYDAMNQALELCNGRYICFLNAGDIFADSLVLTTVADYILQHSYPQFLFGDVLSYEKREQFRAEVDQPKHIIYRDVLSRFYLFRRVICHQTWFVDRKLYNEVKGFDDEYQISAAYDMQLKLLLNRRTSYCHIPRPVAIFQGGGVSSATNRAAKQAERRKILQRHFGPIEHRLYFIAFSFIHLLGLAATSVILPWLPAHLRSRFYGS